MAKLVVLSLQCCPAPPASHHPGCSPPMMPGVRPLCTRLAICLSIHPPEARLIAEAVSAWPPWTFPMLAPSPLTGDVRALISGPLPRYPKCHFQMRCERRSGAWAWVWPPIRLFSAVTAFLIPAPHRHPQPWSGHACPLCPGQRRQSRGADLDQNKHCLDGCLLYS